MAKSFEESVKKYQNIFQKSRLSPDLEIKTIAAVLDEQADRREFILTLTHLFYNKCKSRPSINFFMAPTIEKNLLVSEIDEIEMSFPDVEKEIDLIPLLPDVPYKRVFEMSEKTTVDFLITPAPFVNRQESLLNQEQNTTDYILTNILKKHKNPVLFIRNAVNYEIPFKKIVYYIRKKPLRSDILGWLTILLHPQGELLVMHSTGLKTDELTRLELYCHFIQDYFSSVQANIKFQYIQESITIDEFTTKMTDHPDSLLILQTLGSNDDEINTMKKMVLTNNLMALILPHESTTSQ